MSLLLSLILSWKNINHLLSKCVQTTPCCSLANCWWINICISNDLYGASFSTGKMRVSLTLDSKNHEPRHSWGWMPGVSIAVIALFDNYADEEQGTFQIPPKCSKWRKLKMGEGRKTRTFWGHMLCSTCHGWFTHTIFSLQNALQGQHDGSISKKRKIKFKEAE